MKKFFKITKAVIAKAITFMLLAALSVFNVALRVFTFLFRFVAIPVIFFGLIITAATYFDNGYSTSLLTALAAFAGIGVFYFVLPMIPQVIDVAQLRMTTYVFSPITYRSPVKFTL